MWRIPLILLWLAAAAPASGWAWSVHRLVAFRAMQAVGSDLPLPPARAWPVLWRAAVAPDAQGPGRLPPQDHVFHVPSSPRAKPFGNGPRRIQELTWRLMSEDLPDDQVVFELGRLCHLVADLAQPLHTDGKSRNPDEGRIHPKYESDADADRELGAVAGPPPPPPQPPVWAAGEGDTNGWESRMEALARESWRDYDAICGAYAPSSAGQVPGYPAARAITRLRVEKALAQTVLLWRAILARRGRANRLRREAGTWAFLAVPLVLLFFVIRGRVRDEESRYPGQGPATSADRRRSEQAFARLEARLGIKRDP